MTIYMQFLLSFQVLVEGDRSLVQTRYYSQAMKIVVLLNFLDLSIVDIGLQHIVHVSKSLQKQLAIGGTICTHGYTDSPIPIIISFSPKSKQLGTGWCTIA